MPGYISMPAAALAAAIAFGGAAAMAQQPRVTNGRVSAQPAGTPFAAAFRSLVASRSEITWVAYAIPAVNAAPAACCDDSGGAATYQSGDRGCCGACRLEPSSEPGASRPGAVPEAGPIQLEAGGRLIVAFRVEQGKVERIRVFPADCGLDAGGRAFVWLEGVRPPDSVALLEGLAIAQPAPSGVVEGAVTAIALHRDAAADETLGRLAAPPSPEAVRRKVTFWLGEARGARGLATLQRVLKDDPATEVRRGAVFGVSVSRQAGALEMLSALARSDREPRIRSEALFWMARKAGAKAAPAITDRIDNDPDTGVKKRAVFALSQLPADSGVPLLLDVARTNRNPEVRKQAMFWLGQSNDPRALSFFEEVLAVR